MSSRPRYSSPNSASDRACDDESSSRCLARRAGSRRERNFHRRHDMPTEIVQAIGDLGRRLEKFSISLRRSWRRSKRSSLRNRRRADPEMWLSVDRVMWSWFAPIMNKKILPSLRPSEKWDPILRLFLLFASAFPNSAARFVAELGGASSVLRKGATKASSGSGTHARWRKNTTRARASVRQSCSRSR